MEKMQVRTAIALVGLLSRVERANGPRDVQSRPYAALAYGGHSQPEYGGP